MNINIIGSASFTGYGQVCRNLIIKLTELGHRVAFFPKGQSQFNNEYEQDIIETAKSNGSFYCYDAPTISIWHQHSLAERIGSGPLYGFPYFEPNKFSDREKHHLKGCDKVIAASHWAANILSNQLDKPLEHFPVVPAGVNRDIFYPNNDSENQTSVGPYRFINIGKWEKRKGHDVIIEAFKLAFSPTDNVELAMVTFNPFLNSVELQAWIELYLNNHPMKNNVRLVPKLETQKDLARLINLCHCGIFMSRAEGWNLDLLEVMACGKPVITTCNTGMKDFVNSENSLVVETTDIEAAIDNKWFFGGGEWVKIDKPQIEKAADYMRHCYDEWIVENKPGIETAKQFSWENSAQKLLEVLK